MAHLFKKKKIQILQVVHFNWRTLTWDLPTLPVCKSFGSNKPRRILETLYLSCHSGLGLAILKEPKCADAFTVFRTEAGWQKMPDCICYENLGEEILTQGDSSSNQWENCWQGKTMAQKRLEWLVHGWVKCYKPGNWCRSSQLVWTGRCKSGPCSSYIARGKAIKGRGNSHPWEGDLLILQLTTAKERFLKFSLEGSEFNPIQFGIGSAKS